MMLPRIITFTTKNSRTRNSLSSIMYFLVFEADATSSLKHVNHANQRARRYYRVVHHLINTKTSPDGISVHHIHSKSHKEQKNTTNYGRTRHPYTVTHLNRDHKKRVIFHSTLSSWLTQSPHPTVTRTTAPSPHDEPFTLFPSKLLSHCWPNPYQCMALTRLKLKWTVTTSIMTEIDIKRHPNAQNVSNT